MLNKKIEIGLKLWSTNLHYIDEAKRLWDGGFYDFLELTAVSGSYERCSRPWKELSVPIVIHGPTFAQGLCFADEKKFDENMHRMEEVRRYADLLQADVIVMHPGIEGNIYETVRQLQHLREPRIAVENKPHYIEEGLTCNGYTPEEMELLQREAGVGFCFDVGHAICAANALKKEPFEWMKRFLALKPILFHLTDGDMSAIHDSHWHLGHGNYPIEKLLSYYPDAFRVTLETEHSYPDSLRDFEDDARYIWSLTNF